MKYFSYLVVFLLGASFSSGVYVGATLDTSVTLPQQAKESRASFRSSSPPSTDCQQELDAALQSERRATDARDSLQSKFTRLHYQYEDLRTAYGKLQDKLQQNRAATEDLQSQLSMTKGLLATKKDSLHFVQQQYFDKCDLNQLLVEENEVLMKKLEWHQHAKPKLIGWLSALALILFVVVGGLVVHIQRQQDG